MLHTKRKLLACTVCFFAFMFLCTLTAKSIYASRLPQVTVQTPAGRILEHRLEVSGQVQAAVWLPVYAEPGCRVNKVLVLPGDFVAAGQPLVELDVSELEEQMAVLEQEAGRLQLQIAACQEQERYENKEYQQNILRTQEDIQAALSDAEKQILRAQEDERKAREALEEHERKEFWKAAENGDEMAKQQAYDVWEAERRGLEEQHLLTKRALEDVISEAEAVMRDSTRLLEDSGERQTGQTQKSLLLLELETVEASREKLQALIDAEGMICAKSDGTILQVHVSPGYRTGSEAAFYYADAESKWQFKAVLLREQKQFAETGMSAVLSFGDRRDKSTVTVDHLSKSKDGSGAWEVICELEDGQLQHGKSGVLTFSTFSEQYACCLPLEAVCYDANGKAYVYVLAETETILGKELTVRKCFVEILEKNESYAAVKEDKLSLNTAVVIETTRELAAGDIVRLAE